MIKARSLLRWGVVGGVACAVGLAISQSANAQVNVYSEGGLNVDVSATAGVFFATTRNTAGGAGFDPFGTSAGQGGGNDTSDTSVTYQEVYAQPRADVTYDLGANGQLYGAADAVLAKTFGKGDPAGFTYDHPSSVLGDSYYVGWTSGDSIWTTDFVDASFGAQKYQVGTGFIIWDGHFDNNFSADDAAYWLAPRYAFKRAALLRNDWSGLVSGLTSQEFWLRSDPTHANTALAGVNLDWNVEEYNSTVGVMYFRILEAGDPAFVANDDHRDDLNVYNVRYSGNPIAQMPNWHFAGEWAGQRGDQGGQRLDGAVPEVEAEAWYVEGGYSFADVMWTPDLTYTYASFSGDDPNSAEDEGYDPLFYGYSGWGKWFIGEITGEYWLFNTNFDVHMVNLTFNPYDNLAVHGIFLDFSLDHRDDPFFGLSAGGNDHWGQEGNIIADWSVNDNMAISAAYAVFNPDSAANDYFGAEKTQHLIEAGAWVWF